MGDLVLACSIGVVQSGVMSPRYTRSVLEAAFIGGKSSQP